MITNAIDILKRRYYIMPTYAYMIRRKSDGLFSSGGAYPRFNKTGKIWRNLNTLHNHLSLFRHYSVNIDGKRVEDYDNGIWLLPKPYHDCEVIKFEIKDVSAIGLVKYCKELKPAAKGL